ncbi:MAG: DUF3857 and transglutaminase domain-containing protein [Burkholderiales bacterium]|nr:DUF3857 and transglutaminase domain-containing protein [Burkholderiales bacterium]
MKLHLWQPVAALCVLLQSSLALADAPDLLTRTVHHATTYTLKDDGSSTQQREWAMTVLKPQAVAQARQTSLDYSTRLEKVELIEAYTRKRDGRRIDAPPANVQVKAEDGSDRSTLSVTFPDVAVGDTVVLSYRRVGAEPMFPGQFSVMDTFDRATAYDDVRIKVDAPAALWTQYRVTDLREVQNVEKDGRKVIEWAWDNKQPVPSQRKDFSVVDRDQDPGLSFSTFRSYADLAKAYRTQAQAKAVVSERVQKLADDLTKGLRTPREMAAALSRWVSDTLGHVGPCLGLGNVVPHDPEYVLDNYVGDCKDHATLLQALLAAKGIASTQALINAGNAYRLPKVPVASALDHVINYIPSLDLYVDTTSDDTPFGMLPVADADKPVLRVDGYQDGARTPVPPVGSNQQRMKTMVTVRADGSATGEVKVALKGLYAVNSRASLRAVPKEVEDQMVTIFFRGIDRQGQGVFTKEDPKEVRDTFGYRANFTVKKLFPLPGGGAFKVEPLLYNESPIVNFVNEADKAPEETADTLCGGGRSEEDYTFQFPKGVKVVSIPKEVTLQHDVLSYRARYVLKGQRLTVQRVFDDRTPGNVCSPEAVKAYQQFVRQVATDINAPVVLKQAPSVRQKKTGP